MRPLRYSINITLDGCCDHDVPIPDDELYDLMPHHTANIERADALLFGRVIYEMMEEAWRRPASGEWPDWMSDRDTVFADAIDRGKKYVASSTLAHVDWNAELLQGDLTESVLRLKEEPGGFLLVGGVRFPLALANLGLIDEYELVVHPLIAGRGPTLFDGLREPLGLTLVDRTEFPSGAVTLLYQPRRATT